MADQVKLSPRIKEAVETWDGLTGDDKTYKAVAEAMGITLGRASGYVREGLTKLDRADELPRGRGGNGGQSTEAKSPTEALEAEATKLRGQVTEHEERLTTLRAKLEEYDKVIALLKKAA